MAQELLPTTSARVVHAIHHDLESFYWVLLWVVLRHTNQRLKHKKKQTRQQTCANVFKRGDAKKADVAKFFWLRSDAENLQFSRNRPLTNLMAEFALLVAHNNPCQKGLDYANVLALFNTALAAESWPEDNDGPVDYISLDSKTDSDFSSSEACLSDHRHHHGRKHSRAGKGKRVETTVEQSDDDSDDYYGPWESDDDDEPRLASSADDEDCDWDHKDSVDFECSASPASAPAFDSEREDWQDAADVSAMLGYGMDVQGDAEPANGSAGPTVVERLEDLTLSTIALTSTEPQAGEPPNAVSLNGC